MTPTVLESVKKMRQTVAMGAGKLPEQIIQRTEEGLRAIEEDRRCDPDIERLKAKPVNRVIKPEERNRRRKMSWEIEKKQPTLIERRLMAVQQMLDSLLSRRPKTRSKTIVDQIATLRSQIRRLREKLPTKAKVKAQPHRPKKVRAKKPKRR